MCLYCGDSFDLIKQLATHIAESASCKTEENLQFLSRNGLSSFKSEKEKKLFTCKICNKFFKRKDNYEHHCRTKLHIEKERLLTKKKVQASQHSGSGRMCHPCKKENFSNEIT